MIQEVLTYRCRRCASERIIKNGKNRYGQQQYRCKACGASKVLNPKVRYTPEQKALILQTYQERVSMRAIKRLFGVSRPTLNSWIQKKKACQLPPLAETVLPAQEEDVLEVDELWSFVGDKGQQMWLWSALCRRTRQIVAFALGDRSEATCRRLWEALPRSYQACQSYSDFWEAYGLVFPAATHRAVDKQSGQLAHIERWHNTVRQRLARYVRKTLSFSKSALMHELVTRWFITEYNQTTSFTN